jgi:sugar phosphate isomerase/epimerase
MLKLAGFADEISPDLDEQIRVCRELGITHLELRSVNKINVLDFDAPLRSQIRDKLRAAGLGVASIGSPIGKVKIDGPWPDHFDRFKIGVELAEFFGAPLLRIFSYYPPQKDQDIRLHRDEVLRRMVAKVKYVQNYPVTLVHENEAAIYGDHGKECLDLMRSINSPKLRSAFDFANFIMCGEHPLDNWKLLKPYTVHIHVKDAVLKDRTIVPAGEGDGQIEEILVDAYRSGYREFVSLEPHLARHGNMGGFSGPELFKMAADALKRICRKNNIPLGAAS